MGTYLLPVLSFPITFFCLLFFRHAFLKSTNDIDFIILAIVTLVMSTGPCVVLFINHYLYFKGTTLQYDALTEEFYLNSPTGINFFKKDDIVAITDYSAFAKQVPWHNVDLFEIKLSNTVIQLASIIISRAAFKKLFSGKVVVEKYKYFARIEKPAD